MPRPLPALATALGVAGALAAAAPADASFPGRNGLLAAVLTDGSGARVTNRIVLLRTDGTLVRRLPCPGRCGDIWPAWSPAGQRLAFTAGFGGAPGTLRLGTVAADGSGRRVLPREAAGIDAVAPAWSPDARQLVFGRVGFDAAGLATVPAAGGPVTSLGIGGQEPSWSAGGRLAFTGGGPEQLFTARGDGTGRRQVTRAGGQQPDWSPGGSRIAFLRVRGGREEVWTVAATGRDARRVTTGEMPSWSPDGRRIAVARRGALWTVRTDGADVRRIATPWLRPGQRLTMPAWQPRPARRDR